MPIFAIRFKDLDSSKNLNFIIGPVAQLDRALDYGSRGKGSSPLLTTKRGSLSCS